MLIVHLINYSELSPVIGISILNILGCQTPAGRRRRNSGSDVFLANVIYTKMKKKRRKINNHFAPALFLLKIATHNYNNTLLCDYGTYTMLV